MLQYFLHNSGNVVRCQIFWQKAGAGFAILRCANREWNYCAGLHKKGENFVPIENDDEVTIDLGELFRMLWHNAIWIVLCTVAAAAIGICALGGFFRKRRRANA